MKSKLTLLTLPLALCAFNLSLAQEPTAEDILKKCASVYQDVKSYQDTATLKMAMKMGPGMDMAFDFPATFALEKPNKMRMEMKMNIMGMFQNDMEFVSDGKKMWAYIGAAKQYVETDAPPVLGAPAMPGAPGGMGGAMPNQGFLYAILLSSDPLKALTEGKKNLKLVGSEDIGGKPAYVLTWEQGLPVPDKMPDTPVPVPFSPEKFKNLMLPVKAWVTKEDFLIRQMAIDLSPMMQAILSAFPADTGQVPKEQLEMMKQMQMTMTETHSDIKINQPIPAETFTFKPPAEAKLVKEFDISSMIPGMPGMPGGAPGGEPASPFLGKPAPDFTLKDASGKPLKLSALRGRPVLLNFWSEG